jgi:hypothetical protein
MGHGDFIEVVTKGHITPSPKNIFKKNFEDMESSIVLFSLQVSWPLQPKFGKIGSVYSRS